MGCELYERPIPALGRHMASHTETWCRTHGCQKGREPCLRSIMYDVAHLAATLGSGSDGWLRGRLMSISNALNAAIGRGQSVHGDQYDSGGNITKDDPLKA